MTSVQIDSELAESVTGATQGTSRESEERTCGLWDGTEVFYRHWAAKESCEGGEESEIGVVMFHRGHEHSGRLQHVVGEIDLPAMSFFAWDERGHGRSPGERGAAPSLSHLVKDVDSFITHIGEAHGLPPERLIVLGHSVGAVLVSTWVHDYAPTIRGLILVTPAFKVRLYIPLAIPALRVMERVRGRGRSHVKSYVKSKMLTHDRAMMDSYDRDELITRNIAVNILLDMHDTSKRIVADAGAIVTPTLQLDAGSDWVVSTAVQQRFFDRLGATKKSRQVFAGRYHGLLHEKDRGEVMAAIRGFVTECETASSSNVPDLTKRTATSPSWQRYEQLDKPAVWWRTPKWWLVKHTLGTIGRLSRGVQIGWKHGFDSGQSLDHVYRNHAEGVTPLGRLVDRIYLNSPGWDGIRTRKQNIAALLDRAIVMTKEAGRPVRVLDVASGPGRYLLEAIERTPGALAMLRDRDVNGLEQGERNAESMELADRVTYLPGDAFAPADEAAIEFGPTIVVVSGLYELFPANDGVQRSLAGIARLLDGGGVLVYTNQPWHPQLEMIARTLPNRDGDPWIMRCRPQMEMDQLVCDAGFAKVNTALDEHGIFTVSLASRH